MVVSTVSKLWPLLAIAALLPEALGRRLPQNCTPKPPKPKRGDCIGETTRVDMVMQSLLDLKFPVGLAYLVAQADCRVDLRLFMLDNSGSTSAMDGRKLNKQFGGALEECSRWDEIKDFALLQARDRSSFTEFMQLNPYIQSFCTLDPAKGSANTHELESKLALLFPGGGTPLTRAVQLLRKRLDTEHSDKQYPIVVIAVDGKPNDPTSFWKELRITNLMHQFRLVVRLTASDQELMQSYMDIDKLIGLPYEVVGEFEYEAKKVRDAGNNFFVYSTFIHFIRGRGTDLSLMHRINEKRMTNMDAMRLCEYLLKNDKKDAAFRLEPADYIEDVREKISRAEPVYDSLLQKMAPPVNVAALETFLGLNV
eukprot:TRINITY_DN45799_c0_g1_i1.p1 TRINITY_DN45799_c0_g1~~TRINITY_DN45799_c0_g1_i1.p1  ORF type:complete len:367 (+),score=33.35 TRINITY_DN45799_c0_g1_i1:154-1254(+)